MDTSIFKYGELPQFKKFTPESISKQFPVVLKEITEEFKNIEKEINIPKKEQTINDKLCNTKKNKNKHTNLKSLLHCCKKR